MRANFHVILGPATGIPSLDQVFHPGSCETSAWVVVQRHVDGEALETLAECLEEMAEHPVRRLGSVAIPLSSGTCALVGDAIQASLEGHRLVPQVDSRFELDGFLVSFVPLGAKLSLAILPGRDMEGSGLTGLMALQTGGVQLLAANEDQEAWSWANRLEASGIHWKRKPLAKLFD